MQTLYWTDRYCYDKGKWIKGKGGNDYIEDLNAVARKLVEPGAYVRIYEGGEIEGETYEAHVFYKDDHHNFPSGGTITFDLEKKGCGVLHLKSWEAHPK